MKKDMNSMLKFLASTEAISPKDELSKMIEDESEDELTAEMLDRISAAASPDYEKWKKFLEESEQ